MTTLVNVRKHILAPILVIIPMLNACTTSYDVSCRVSGDSPNVEIEYSIEHPVNTVTGIDLQTGDWVMSEEVVDFWEQDCQADDPSTEEDESISSYCQNGDEKYSIYLNVINRDTNVRSISVKIYIDDRLVDSKEDSEVYPGYSVTASYYIADN